ncbi:hypothetical protein GOODEAATRI_016548, partial [Goodea atripinnis]
SPVVWHDGHLQRHSPNTTATTTPDSLFRVTSQIENYRDVSIFSEGLPVRLQGLLPNAGEILLLEGPPRSGKTTVANILLSSWTNAASKFFDASILDLFMYVNCSTVKADLFQEATSQLSLSEKISAEELRTVLSQSNKTLLLLDGYKEGNHCFDETLRRFLSERGTCRILVTSCLGDCPVLKQTLKTEGTLKLQIQSAKY